MTRIIGIDPGFGRCGVAVMEGEREKPVLLYSSCIETPSGIKVPARIGEVCDRIRDIIHVHRPEAMAIEEIFFSNNQKTAINVAALRGALIYLATQEHMEVFEYNPASIKVAVTGSGNASKLQIFTILPKLITIPEEKKRLDDEYDAIAVGITHLASFRKNIQK